MLRINESKQILKKHSLFNKRTFQNCDKIKWKNENNIANHCPEMVS